MVRPLVNIWYEFVGPAIIFRGTCSNCGTSVRCFGIGIYKAWRPVTHIDLVTGVGLCKGYAINVHAEPLQ